MFRWANVYNILYNHKVIQVCDFDALKNIVINHDIIGHYI